MQNDVLRCKTTSDEKFVKLVQIWRKRYDITRKSTILYTLENALAKKIKEIIDTKSSFADWLNNQIVRDQLKFDIKVCLIKNGYPPQYSPEVFRKVMEQVENFEEHN